MGNRVDEFIRCHNVKDVSERETAIDLWPPHFASLLTLLAHFLVQRQEFNNGWHSASLNHIHQWSRIDSKPEQQGR